jgi:hypothetical protein
MFCETIEYCVFLWIAFCLIISEMVISKPRMPLALAISDTFILLQEMVR